MARIAGPPVIHSDTGEWPFSAGPIEYHTVRFVYPMEIVGGSEQREVGGSTDELGWFLPEELSTMTLGDLVSRVVEPQSERRPAASSA